MSIMDSPSIMDHIDQITVISLLAVLALLFIAYSLSRRALSRDTLPSIRILFIWHAFDSLIHIIIEGSFLYNCFFTHAPLDLAVQHSSLITNFLNRPDRLYGAAYGDNWATKLWMVYAQADKRWAGADLTVISLELLTVLGAGPLAAYICWGMWKRDYRISFWMIVLATAELYGSFMTFCPEWLTGNQNLDTSNFMYLWVYLVFFNMLWIVLPIYALWVAYTDICNGSMRAGYELETKKKESEKTK